MATPQVLRIDLLDRLTVIELDIASRILKEDIVHAITAPTAGRWRGLAVLAYMTAKKNGHPTSRVEDYLALDSEQLIAELARLAGDSNLLEDLEAAGDDLERAEAQARADLEDGLEAAQAAGNPENGRNRSVSANESANGEVEKSEPNPTPPTSAFSSPGRGAPTLTGSPA